MDSNEFGADIAITPQEDLVMQAYRAMDEAAARGLEQLHSEDGIIPACKSGCSHPLSCLAANNPESAQDAPVVLTSILTVTKPFSIAIKDIIENSGIDFSKSIMLLPHWLAIQMDWDFAISP